MRTARVNETVVLVWAVLGFDGDLLIGQLNTDFTASVLMGTTADAQVIAITETAVPGVYAASFVPATAGLWTVTVVHPSTGNVYQEAVQVGTTSTAQVMLVTEGSTAYIEAWMERDGAPVKTPVSATVYVRDRDGVLIATAASASPDARGHFTMSASATFLANRPYNVIVLVADASGVAESYQAFGTVQ